MLKFLARSFEKICSVLAWINQIFWLLVGIGAGFFIVDYLHIGGFLGIVCIVGISIVGLVFGFISNVIVFGFFAQIVTIRKSLEKET